MPGRSPLYKELKRDFDTRKYLITKRLKEFEAVYKQGDQAIFEELCYCIVTAGSSAKMGMRTIDVLRDILITGTLEELQNRAQQHRLRFWRIKPAYIVQTRDFLRQFCNLKLRSLLESFDCKYARRDFFARNPLIKGLGYKEASHFLRNIGFQGYAILDKHILNSLHEMRVITKTSPPSTRKHYLAIEKKLELVAQDLGMDIDHLDLLLWSRKTGEILK
ncbi:MAG: hypothetical protein WC539_06085 [Nitrospirota bacterium]